MVSGERAGRTPPTACDLPPSHHSPSHHSRLHHLNAAPLESTSMDFDLNDEQRQLKDSLDRLLADSYGDLNKRHGYMKEPKGYSAGLWKQYADLGLLAVPFAEEHGGLGPGPDRDHDRRRGVRPRARHRALSRHRRAERRRAAPFRQRRAAEGAGAGHRRGQADAGAGASGAAGALRPRRHGHHGALRRQGRLYAGGREVRGARRRQRRQADRHGARRRAAAPTAAASACSWSTPRPTASPAAAIPRRTACAPPT